jgi:hypothetical protein
MYLCHIFTVRHEKNKICDILDYSELMWDFLGYSLKSSSLYGPDEEIVVGRKNLDIALLKL